ncbi:MAG TPA: xanthine dehydrogenase molybdopterin binding subunit [Tepidisphaeraceae bacterium]|jgi:xanthine dehydrogenase large subunit
MSVVGKAIPHESAAAHAAGQSLFIDDIPPARNELFVDVVGSPVAHGRLRRIDTDAARAVAGVVGVFDHSHIPGHNAIGPVVKDEHLLVETTADFLGDPVVLVAATSREALAAARRMVRIEMDELPPVFTIEQAIAKRQFLGPPRIIERGDVSAALRGAEFTLSGELQVGGQDHFYLESQAAIAYPQEGGAMVVHSSTQHPTEVQQTIAEVLGLPFNAVTVLCRRMGGGFGGKETQAAQPAAFAAMVARLTGRPARVVYSKDDDMRITGKRHPFMGRYRVAFTRAGLITGLSLELYSNGGCSTDLSLAVLERAMLHADNAYFIPHFRVIGQVCKTNLPSNTAFRGFGGPQGVVNIENVIEQIAMRLGIDALDVRERNLYGARSRGAGRLDSDSWLPTDNGDGNGDGWSNGTAREDDRVGALEGLTTPYGQIIGNNVLPDLIGRLRKEADYDWRRQEIAAFNARSRTQVKGLALTPVKFGISFTKQHMNQANALVNLYTDGTVLVTTGATEMGQGVYTRIRQLVADELGVSYDAVRIGTTDTSKNNNTSPSAASATTDLNGAAAVNACQALRARLAEFAAQQIFNDPAAGLAPSPSHVTFAQGEVFDARRPDRRLPFGDLVMQAHLHRVNLGERGFYATPGVDFNRDTGKGTPFLYYTNGAAAAEVLIDRFTGELTTTRVDLVMDAGVPLNPGIDRGQIVGGFVQGMGWVTTEELKYGPGGELLSHSPTTYKIPNIGDLPATFNVSFFGNPDCSVSLRRSKALGEPPLLLAISVWAAVKNAIAHVHPTGAAQLALPATPEEILTRLTGAPSPDLWSPEEPTPLPAQLRP